MMIQTRNDLPPKTRKQMAALLNARLADAADLYSHAKQAHWNVRDPRFIALHELFDKVAEMAAGHADELAERAGQLGGEVTGTVRQTAVNSGLREYPLAIAGGAEHVDALAESVAAFTEATRKAIDAATDADDAVTADVFTTITRASDKMLWFIESHKAAVAPDQRKTQAA